MKHDYYTLDEQEVIKKTSVIFIGFLISAKKKNYVEHLPKEKKIRHM